MAMRKAVLPNHTSMWPVSSSFWAPHEDVGRHFLTHSIIRSDTYHIWVKRGGNLLINEIIPVNWGEEDVILNLRLLGREKK